MRKNLGLLDRIRLIWASGLVIFFLLNIDQYLYAVVGGFAPKFWIIGALIGTLFLFASRLGSFDFLKNPVLWWAMWYLFISLFWCIISADLDRAVEGLMLVITTFIFSFICLLIYPVIDKNSLMWGGVLWFALLVAVIANCWEYFLPLLNPFYIFDKSIAGRSAGFYLNANISAQAILMISLCILARGNLVESVVAIIAALVGVFFTFSRGGMLVFFFIAILFFYRKKFAHWVFLVVISLCFLYFIADDLIFDSIFSILDIDNANALQRAEFIFGRGSLGEFSDQSRSEVFWVALDQFVSAPFAGNGLGYMSSLSVGTHNLLLRHLIEYGMFGFFVFSLFFICSLKAVSIGIDKVWVKYSVAVVFVLSMFSHNMLEQPSFLLPWLALFLVSSTPSLDKN